MLQPPAPVPRTPNTETWVVPSGIGARRAGTGGILATDGVIEVAGDLGAFKDAYKVQFEGVDANAGRIMLSLRVDVSAFVRVWSYHPNDLLFFVLRSAFYGRTD